MPVEQDIGGFDIAVDHSLRMRRLQGEQRLAYDLRRLRRL